MNRIHEMRFWQKIYLICLALFLVIVCTVLIFIGWQSQEQLTKLEVKEAQTAHYHIQESLEKDLAFMKKNKRISEDLLLESYARYYGQENKRLELRQGSRVLYSNLPKFDDERKELSIAADNQNWLLRDVKDKTYLYVAGKVTADKTEYILTLTESFDSITKMWNRLQAVYIAGSLCAAIILGLLLYFILKKMFKPLSQLEETAASFSNGDFTARAKAAANDEIGHLTESFNGMADSAEKRIIENKKMADKNEFMAASLSHEIRTPLTNIRGYSEYMRMADLSEEEKISALDRIISESERLQKLSEKVLDLFKLNHETIHFETIDLRKIIADAAHHVDLQEIPIAIQITEPVCTPGDKTLLNRLFVNLIENSVKACKNGGEITISVHDEDKRTKIVISDTGEGMSESELKRIGEPFYRPDSSRNSQNGGNGLGIAICYQIARSHSWQINYSSKKGQGTKVELSFTTP